MRSRFEWTAEVLQEAMAHPTRARSRIVDGADVQYAFLDSMIKAGLVEEVAVDGRRRRLRVTDRGRLFLTHFRACVDLFPEVALTDGASST